MSFAWHEIRDHLMHSSSNLHFQRSFDAVRRAQAALAPFRDPAALLDGLHRTTGDPAQKNLILSALVGAAQGDGPASDCALTLLLLALWPGLDAIRRRSHLAQARHRRRGRVRRSGAHHRGGPRPRPRARQLDRGHGAAQRRARHDPRAPARPGARTSRQRRRSRRGGGQRRQRDRRGRVRTAERRRAEAARRRRPAGDPRGDRGLLAGRGRRRTGPDRGRRPQAVPARHAPAARRPRRKSPEPMSRSGPAGGFSHSSAPSAFPPTESRHA